MFDLTHCEEHLFQLELEVLSRPVQQSPRYIKIKQTVLKRRVSKKKI